MARTVVTLIPVIDQIGDLQDLTASVYHLVWKEEYNKPIPLEHVLSEFGLTMADWDTMGKTPLPGENGAGNG